MKSKDAYWLPHLKDTVPVAAYGDHLCRYAIALEGWRRGLELTFFRLPDDRVRYNLNYNGKKREFAGSKSDLTTKKADMICSNKYRAKEYLSNNGVSVPQGKMFREKNDDEEILDYSKALGFPVVLKPHDGAKGKGVFSNIQDEEEMRDALFHVRKELKLSQVIVERHFQGKEYRVFVIEDMVIGVITKIPANVVGDGKNTIKKLIGIKNRERKKNPHLSSRLIKVDNEVLNFVKKNKLTLESVPKKGEQIFLREKSSLSAGGDSIDATDDLPNEMKDITIHAVKAVPGLLQCGVDLMVDKKNNSGVVIELNARAQIGSHLFPMEGQARDVPKAIIDYYFPETKDKSVTEKSLYYFDYEFFVHHLKSGVVNELTVPQVPEETGYIRGYIISGNVQRVGYRLWIRNRAKGLNLNGFAKNLENGNVLVVVAGNEENIAEFNDVIHNEKNSKAVVESVDEKKWTEPVKVGFELADEQSERLEADLNDKKKKIKDTEANLHQILEKNKKLQHRKSTAKKKYKDIEQSRIWRYTSPVRKTFNFIKKRRLSFAQKLNR